MKDERECEAGPANQSWTPVPGSGTSDIARAEEVIAEDDRVSGGPSEENTIGCIKRSDEVFRSPDEVFEVVLFSSVAREGLEGTNDPLVGRSLLDGRRMRFTEPQTTYTHIPAAAMTEPMTHMKLPTC